MDENHIHLTIHFADVKHLLHAASDMEKRIMATLDDVKAAAAAERAEVQARIDVLVEAVTNLQALVAAGTNVTAADLDDVKTKIEAISEPIAAPLAHKK